MNKVVIINNFGMFPTTPPNSTSKVCNLLKRSGLEEVIHIDLNLKLWQQILDVNFLKKCQLKEDRLINSNVTFCEKVSDKTFEIIKENVLENIIKAISIIKSKESFAHTETLSWAVNIIFQAQQIIYYNYGTFIHNKMIFWPEIGSDTNDLDTVFKYSEDRDHNPFIELIENNFIKELVSMNPDVIGIDILFPWEIVQVVTLNKIIKKYLPNTHINYIGYGFDEFCYSRIAENITKNKKLMLEFDSVFLVRNDKSLTELYTSVTVDKKKLESIAYRNEENEVIVNGPFYENVIDNTIVPDYSDLNLGDYYSPELVFTDKLSNKCFWNKCTFCNINKFKSDRCEISIEKYLKQIQDYISKYNCRNLFLLDEAATPKLVEIFSNGLLSKKIDITWSIRTRIDKCFDENLIKLMHKAGCREMWIGFEAASPRILRYMNKTEEPSDYVNIAHKEMELCKKYGIGLHFCLILGFPNELEEDRKILKEFFKENNELISRMPFFVTFNCFNLNTETYIYDHYKEFGIDRVNYDFNKFNMINIPFIRKDTGKPQSEIEMQLEPFCDELTNIFVQNVAFKLLWYTISDSSWEMLFKKYNNEKNPFQDKPGILTKMIISLYIIITKNPTILKLCNKFSNNKIVTSKTTMYH